MDAMDRVIAEMSPDDTAAALRLSNGLEACRQMSPTEADQWRRRIEARADFDQLGSGSVKMRPPEGLLVAV